MGEGKHRRIKLASLSQMGLHCQDDLTGTLLTYFGTTHRTDPGRSAGLHASVVGMAVRVGPQQHTVAAHRASATGAQPVLLAAEGRHSEARPLFARALRSLTGAYGDEHAVVARLLHEQGSSYAQLGQYVMARTSYENALSIREKILTGNDPELAESLDGLGVMYLRQSDFGRAESLLRRALAIHESAGSSRDADLGLTLSHLGRTYLAQQKNAQAERPLRRALELLEPALGAQDPVVAQTRREYRLVLQGTGSAPVPAAPAP